MWHSVIHQYQSIFSGHQMKRARSSGGMRSMAARVLAHENTQSFSAVNGKNRSKTSPSLSSVLAADLSVSATGRKMPFHGPMVARSSHLPVVLSALASACAPCVSYCLREMPRGSKRDERWSQSLLFLPSHTWRRR
jgi:hypothetical protein